MLYYWDKFVVEGETLYNYMINNFNDMIYNDNILHFYIRDGIYGGIETNTEFIETYNKDIENELIIWIMNEYKENRLFNRELWKPFRDRYTLSDMYNGYRKLFKFKHIYFQLAMETECNKDECKYCTENEENNTIILCPHFCLALYGWKVNNSNNFEPSNKIKIPDDFIMIEKDWVYK
jgi:hypothetical protein